jgi:hypothetical protein
MADCLGRSPGTRTPSSSMASACSCTAVKSIHSGKMLPTDTQNSLLMLRRLPVLDLYIDIFQKVKSLGYNMVSFYVDWALLEGKPGVYREEGVFDLQPFYDAAQAAGIYLLARPGPYINAEVSGGGFPGWLQRVNGTLRTRAQDYLNATDKYLLHS